MKSKSVRFFSASSVACILYTCYNLPEKPAKQAGGEGNPYSQEGMYAKNQLRENGHETVLHAKPFVHLLAIIAWSMWGRDGAIGFVSIFIQNFEKEPMPMQSNTKRISRICGDIPNHQSFIRIEAVNKGVSGEDKYRVETAQGQRFLLRISDMRSYERKKIMYDMMGRAAALGVSMSLPVDFGICNGGKNVYQLLSWCEGETAEAVLPKLARAEQYALGVKAGQNLRKIHSISAPGGIEDWYDRFARINDGRIRAFFDCGVHIEGSEAILAFYEENRRLLRGRPQCFIHGDYHNGNLIISENRGVAVVDWDLLDSLYGDPWSEFNRILHTELIPHFATGELHGYFGGEPPEAFWRIFALYLSTGALMLVSWAVYLEPGCLDECKQTASRIMHWFDGMRSPAPKWYVREIAPLEL